MESFGVEKSCDSAINLTRFHICRKAPFSKLSHCKRIPVFLSFPFNPSFWWPEKLLKDGFSMFSTRISSPATEVGRRHDASAEPWTGLVPDRHQQSLLTNQLRPQLSSLCSSRNVLQAPRSFLARHPLRAWTHLCAQLFVSY